MNTIWSSRTTIKVRYSSYWSRLNVIRTCHLSLLLLPHKFVQFNIIVLNWSSYLYRDVIKGCCQHTVGAGLSSKGLTYQHETMPHYHHLKDLQDFLHKEIGDLQVHAYAVIVDGLQQNAVVSCRELDAREEVRGDTLRWKRQVRRKCMSTYTQHTVLTSLPTCKNTITLRCLRQGLSDKWWVHQSVSNNSHVSTLISVNYVDSNRLKLSLCIVDSNKLSGINCSINQDKRSPVLLHLKKLQIVGQELGQIDINYGSQQQGVFILLWKSELQGNKPGRKLQV